VHSIRVSQKIIGDPYYELTIVVHDSEHCFLNILQIYLQYHFISCIDMQNPVITTLARIAGVYICTMLETSNWVRNIESVFHN